MPPSPSGSPNKKFPDKKGGAPSKYLLALAIETEPGDMCECDTGTSS